ncbi:glycosyl hydrolase family 95 catalytic domain-containing protein [Micromonospora echinospora]|uniref:glycosyl hydrolase family 95 catalytic domain-containing protein n=1 Tax=Micromonospora echinospora TaxID=1877 RepID=UPI003CF929EE
MSGVERRQFLQGVVAAGVASTVAVPATARPAAASGVAPSVEPYEWAVRDATMRWATPPTGWSDAPFLGDGRLTAQVHPAEDGRSLVFALGVDGAPWHAPSARLALPLAGTLTGVDWRLDPWDAELTGSVTTTRGHLRIAVVVPHGSGVAMVDLRGDGAESGDGELVAAEPGASAGVRWYGRRSGSRRTVVIGPPVRDPRGMLAKDGAKVTSAHREWWHRFYRGSFVSVPDKTLQRFHWLQLYAAAVTDHPAAGGESAALVDAANHAELHPASTAARTGSWPHSFDHLLFATPGAGLKSGDAENPVLAWHLPELWSNYRYGNDVRLLRDVLRPLLRSAVGYYRDFLVPGADGRLHLPATYSPGHGDVEDCTHDLALVRWATARLVETGELLGDDERAVGEWRELLRRLVPYHRDETGVLIGAGVRLTTSQPRPAHLVWLDPLQEMSGDRPADRALMRRSFDHWAGMPAAWTGRSHLSAASMAVLLRSPEEALSHLRTVVRGTARNGTELLANTLYRQGGEARPDASFAAARVLLGMLVGAGGPDLVDVFPAVPGAWADVSIAGMRAPGAVVIDASRRGGRTEGVRITSMAGRPVVLRHGIAGAVEVRDSAGRRLPVRSAGAGALRLDLAAGVSATVAVVGRRVDLEVRDVPTAAGAARDWGLSRGQGESARRVLS